MSWNRRIATAALFGISVIILLAIMLIGTNNTQNAMETDFSRKNLPPSFSYPFGTDWLGRDMFIRTLCGLSLSIHIGLLTAVVSAAFAFLLGSAAAIMGKAADSAVSFLIDLAMGVPHMLLLILVAFACGRGLWGVIAGVTLSHWMPLARVIRGEVLQLKHSGYVLVAAKLGQSRFQIVKRHMLAHLLPQFIVGIVLLFPHAVLHEASITFLGFGLPPDQPTVGIILSESMRYLVTGHWWLSVLPGLALAAVAAIFDCIGSSMRKLLDPAGAHE